MKKEKIYFLINSMEGGGAERIISTLSDKLSTKYDIDLITFKKEVFYKLPETVNHISLSNIKNNLLMALFIPYYVIKLKKILKTNNYKSGVSALEIANFVHILSKKNPIISFHTSISSFGFRGFISRFYKFLIKFLYPKAFKIIVSCDENKYDLANFLNISYEKIYVINNPINIEDSLTQAKEKVDDNILEKIKGKKVFITVGRLIKLKNHSRILKAFSQVYKNIDKNFVYIIVGDGPEKENLEKIACDLGVQNNVIFVGVQKNVFKFLAISNYFVYASIAEGFGNVLIEAMSMGLPIITSNFKTGAQEVIFGNYDKQRQIQKYLYGPNGVIINLDNFEQNFVEIYNELVSLKQSKAGFERFNVKNVVKEWEKILES